MATAADPGSPISRGQDARPAGLTSAASPRLGMSPSPRSRRCMSVKDLRSDLGNLFGATTLSPSASLSNLGSECGESTRAGAPRAKRLSNEGTLSLEHKGRTIHSEKMSGGADVKQVMSYSPGQIRRQCKSVSPLGLRHGEEDNWDNQSLVNSLRSGDFGGRTFQGSMASPGRSPRTPARSPRPMAMSPRSQSAVSLSDLSTGSPSAASDRNSVLSARLRGQGVTIGLRGKSSMGIPWRHIPVYDAGGALQSTGDIYASPEAMRKDSGLPRRGKGGFSPRLKNSQGMHDILETVSEHRDGITSPAPALSDRRSPRSPFTPNPLSPGGALSSTPHRDQENAPSPGTLDGDNCNVSVASDGQPRQVHWAFKRQRKGWVAETATKDHCPFHREDSKPQSRACQSPQKRGAINKSPRPSLTGASPGESGGKDDVHHKFVAEKVTEARRDWQYIQDKPTIDKDGARSPSRPASPISPEKGYLANTSTSSSRLLSRSSSVLSCSEIPVHSTRARPPPDVARRPRWRG